MANFPDGINYIITANTPDPPDSISLDNIRSVFDGGYNNIPGDDLNDFHGFPYYEVTWPFRAAKFNINKTGPLTLQDFYSKTATDPIKPGFVYDDVCGSNKSSIIPAFRNYVRIELWGAGGGGGSGDHDSYGGTGGAGGSTSFSTTANNTSFTITAGGGGGGTGGYRYGNQNGSGGGGGIVSNTAVTVGRIDRYNGNSGSNGAAGAGHGGAGGSSPFGSGTGGTYGGANRPSKSGSPGNKPGGGGGGGGDSDFQSGKNANPNQSAGGGGGSGSYASVILTRSQISPGMKVNYNVGCGGNSSTGNQGNGAKGADGAFKISWDYPIAFLGLTPQKFIIDDWSFHFGGCYGAGYNDLTIMIGSSQFTYAGKTTGTSGGIIISVTGAAADYGVASPGHVGRWNPNQHTNVTDGYIYDSYILLNGDPIKNQTTGWWSAYSCGRDNMAFRAVTSWNGSSYTVTIQGNCKGGDAGAASVVNINQISPEISYTKFV